jgi:hypothetical protein
MDRLDLATQSLNHETLVVETYRATLRQEWDEFVRHSKNGTFLFHREYMEYHQDRFVDASLMVRDRAGRLLTLMPANRDGDTLISHGGLTYGGFVTDTQMTAPLMLSIFGAFVEQLRRDGYRTFRYKATPHIYHRHPADEDLYALFRAGARLYRRDVTTAVAGALPFQERRSRAIKKARRANVLCGESDQYSQFWDILEWNLRTAHSLKPVHTLAEIRQLHAAFPDEIKLFGALSDGEFVAGTLVYVTPTVAHAQYTASSEKGRTCGALDLLFSHLLTDVYRDKRYFDFGVSTESNGQSLNDGLVNFKEGFGGRTIVHDFYEVTL